MVDRKSLLSSIFLVCYGRVSGVIEHTAELITAVFNTLIVAAGTLVLALPVAIFLAVSISRTNMFGARWAWLAVCSQLVVPLYALVGAWSAGFGTQGWWPLSQVAVAGSWLAKTGAVTFIHAMAAIPSCALILSLGAHWTRRSREEMALMEGGNRNLIRRVLLPDMRGWIAAAGFWAIVPVLTEMVVTNLYQLPTLPEQVYLDISLGTASSLTYAVSIGLCMVPLLIVAWWLRKHLPALSTLAEQISQHAPRQLDLRGWRWPVSLLAWMLVLLLVAVPSLNLLIKAGWQAQLDSAGQLQHAWSLSRFVDTLRETCATCASDFQWSATLAATSATLALAIACCLRSAWVSGRSELVRHTINIVCLVLIAMPGPLVASLVTQLFMHVPLFGWFYDRTLLAPVLAQQTRLLPLAWLIVGGILSSVSRPAWEMAQVDQLSLWTQWRTLVWRPTRRLWLLAWIVLAAVSAGELSTNLLLLPAGVTTVAQHLFELLHYGMRYRDSGLCLALVAVGWLVGIVVWNTRAGRA